MDMAAVVDLRTLNRTLLARQGLLDRPGPGGADVEGMVGHLVGLQSQTPSSPYTALWTRLAPAPGFDFAEPGDLLEQRRLVRLVLMRGTVHMATAEDALLLRPWLQPALERGLRASPWAPRLHGVDRAAVVGHARDLMREQPRTPAELRAAFAAAWPDADAEALVQGLRVWAPLVQVPPRGVWGRAGGPRYAVLDDWLGRPPADLTADADPSADPGTDPDVTARVVRRYLAAFGPATPADMQKWSGLTGLKDAFAALGLRTYTDKDDGRLLYDLPDADLADPATDVPACLVADFDNLLLSHADRTRVLAAADRTRVITVNGLVRGTVLIDGFVGGVWQFGRTGDAAEVVVTPFAPLRTEDRASVEEQARRYLDDAAPGAAPTVRFATALQT